MNDSTPASPPGAPSTPGSDAATPTLPSELTIYTVGDHVSTWLDWLQAGDAAPALAVNASTVTQVDAAGLQMLVSLGHGLKRRDRALRLHRPSPALSDGCRMLGLSAWLEDASGQGAAV